MLNRKYQSIVFAFFMALLMSGIMSLIISIYNLGLVNNILHIWLKAWGFAFVVAFPVAMLVSPTVRGLVNLIIRNPT